MFKDKITKKDNGKAIRGVMGSMTRILMMKLKEDRTEKGYTKSVNDLIGIDENIDVYEIIMSFGKEFDKDRILARTAMVNYLLQDDDRTSIMRRATEVMNTKNGKALLYTTYSSLGIDLYEYVDDVFDYSFALMMKKEQISLTKFIACAAVTHLLLGGLGFLMDGNVMIALTPVPEIIGCVIMGFNMWSYNRLQKKRNHQTPQELLAKTDNIKKFDLLTRCISDISEMPDTEHTKFIEHLSHVSEKLNMLVQSGLYAIKLTGGK